jgi:NTP pyrophosphatase (non-canonical NTP hydrolase)
MSQHDFDILKRVNDEALDAQIRYGSFASMHEGYGVLAEEVAELFDAIRMRQEDTQRGPSIEKEAIQVAAVALRIARQAQTCSR